MKKLGTGWLALGLALVLACVGCSGDGADGQGGGAATSTAPGLSAPTVVSLTETKGSGKGLNITWTLADANLTGVEVWRKADSGSYAKVTTVTGTTTAYFDATATGMRTYCYELKALRGAAESGLSKSKCLMTGM